MVTRLVDTDPRGRSGLVRPHEMRSAVAGPRSFGGDEQCSNNHCLLLLLTAVAAAAAAAAAAATYFTFLCFASAAAAAASSHWLGLASDKWCFACTKCWYLCRVWRVLFLLSPL